MSAHLDPIHSFNNPAPGPDAGAAPGADLPYGWQDALAPHSCDYLTPQVMQILRRLAVRRVLDMGAGNGALCRVMQAAGLDVVGLEVDEQGVEIARSAQPSTEMVCCGVESDPQELLASHAPFEAVVSTEVVEHLYSPHHLPRYAAAVLKPRGWLVITTPYHGYLKNLALSLMGHWDRHHTALWHGGHIKFWSRATLTQLLEEQGFEVIEFHGVGRMAWLWKSMVLVARLK